MTEAACWLMTTKGLDQVSTIRAMTSWYERQATDDASPPTCTSGNCSASPTGGQETPNPAS
jgi:hypothetical protein